MISENKCLTLKLRESSTLSKIVNFDPVCMAHNTKSRLENHFYESLSLVNPGLSFKIILIVKEYLKPNGHKFHSKKNYI